MDLHLATFSAAAPMTEQPYSGSTLLTPVGEGVRKVTLNIACHTKSCLEYCIQRDHHHLVRIYASEPGMWGPSWTTKPVIDLKGCHHLQRAKEVSDLDKILSEVSKEDKWILLGVGRNHHLWRGTLGREGVGKTNCNGILLTKCSEHILVITNTLFCQNIMDASSVQTMASHWLRHCPLQRPPEQWPVQMTVGN